MGLLACRSVNTDDFGNNCYVQGEASDTDEQLCQVMMDLTIEEDVSMYLPKGSSSGSSSSEISNGHQAMADKLSVQRPKMNEFLRSCNAGSVGRYKKRWEKASIRTKQRHVLKAKDAVVAALNVIAPGDAGHLWEALKDSNSVEKALQISEECPADKRHLEALAETYQNASSFISKSPRMRVEGVQLDHFLTFITSPHVIQDLPFGQRYLHLSSGKVLETPNVIRTMIPQRIVRQYQQYCEETNFKPFSANTMLRILSVCSATVRKSLQGVDYVAADGAKAFDDLCHMVERLEEYGLSAHVGNAWERSLKSGKQYLKSDYKVKTTILLTLYCQKSNKMAHHKLSRNYFTLFSERCHHKSCLS